MEVIEQRIALCKLMGWEESWDHALVVVEVQYKSPDGRVVREVDLPEVEKDYLAVSKLVAELQHYAHYCDLLAEEMGVERGSLLLANAPMEKRVIAVLKYRGILKLGPIAQG